MNQQIEKLLAIAKDAYNNGDPSHDFLHILRVIENCKKIGKSVGADMDILIPAAILHDIVHIPKNSPDRIRASEITANRAQQILIDLMYSEEQIKKIKQVIVEHSFSRGLKPSSVESQVLQDADRLDGLGAIGVMRNVTTGALMKADYYHFNEPWAKTRDLDDKKYTIDHYFVKLFKLPDLMNTKMGRAEALKRIEFMHSFLEQLKKELDS